MSTFALSAMSARALAAEMGGEADWQRIVRLPQHTALVDHGPERRSRWSTAGPLAREPTSTAQAGAHRTRLSRRFGSKILEALGTTTAERSPYSALNPAERRRLAHVMVAHGRSAR